MKKQHLHFMGIGGQGISAVAQMAFLTGGMVTGCDRDISSTVIELQQQGFAVQIGHSADHLDGVDTLVISPAVPALDPQNPELLAARQLGVPVVTWQELLGQLMRGKCVLSVSGVHGKSTTTSMLSLILTDAGLDPTCMIGAVVPRFGVNYRLGRSQYFVNEADEFNHNFWYYHPRLAIVKSIEYEHPEFFADYEAFLAAFEHFVRGMDMDGDWPLPPTLLLNADNAGCLELLERLRDWSGRVLTFSIEGGRDKSGSYTTGNELPGDLNKSGGGRDNSGPYTAGNELPGDLSPIGRGPIHCAHSSLSEPPTFEAYDIKLDGETSFRVRIRDNSGGSDNSGPYTAGNELPGDLSPIGRGPIHCARLSPTRIHEKSGRDKSGPYTAGNELPGDLSPIGRGPIHCARLSPFPERVIHLRLPGVFNIENALSALAAAHCLGIPADSIIATLEGFGGTRRRFDIQHEGLLQLKNGKIDDVMLVDDYAHHPTAIAATLEGARRRYPDRRLVAVYQPHMYSRTKAFFEQFLEAFDMADVVIIADIFPAREHDTGLVHSRDLVAELVKRSNPVQRGSQSLQVYHGGNAKETTQVLASILHSGDLAVIMGAGDIYVVTDQLLHLAEETKEEEK